MEPLAHDAVVERMARLPDLKIGLVTYDKQGQHLQECHSFAGAQLARELVIDDTRLHDEVRNVSVQVAHWGRLAAQARRNWQFVERTYRVWRDNVVLQALTPPSGPSAKDWKKPTEKHIEATYRAHPNYMLYQTGIEVAEEAYNAAQAMLDGFRAKKDMLRHTVVRSVEDSTARLAV